MRLLSHPYWIAYGIASCLLVTISPVCAQQVSTDGTLSTSVTSPDGRNFTITDGNRAGGNLFHSFSEFSLPAGGEAFFNNATDVQNIISRVTGGRVSNIDGLIRANGSANLFLINPSGVVFGPNASLNIGGSFVASSASSLKFSDGKDFSATDNISSPLLSVSVPVGLQYGATPAGINVQGSNLAVQPERTLALLGGNVTLTGSQLTAPSGRVELGAVAGAGTVELASANNQLQLSFPNSIPKADVLLTNEAKVSASGSGGGDIQLTGRRIAVDRSRVEANTLGSEPGGNFTVNASDFVELIGKDIGELFDSGLFAETQDAGAASNLSINTKQLVVRGDARVSAATFGAGQGGNLTVNASDSVELVGVDPPNDETLGQLFTGLLTDSHSTGAAGNLAVQTRRLVVRDGAQITAANFGEGNGGNLTVNVADSVELIGVSPSDLLSSGLYNAAQPTATGSAGELRINTGRLIVRDGAQIFAGTNGAGNGGNLTVNVSEFIEATGVSPVLLFPSGLFSTSADSLITGTGLTAGSSGDVTINTDRLVLRDGAKVETASVGNAGRAGSLNINARRFVELSGTGPADAIGGRTGIVSNTTAGSSNSGNVTINTDRLIVRDGARVDVNNQGSGNGGELTVNARSLNLDNEATLTAATASGEGGNINLQLQNILSMRRNSEISAEAGGSGNGGNIDIQANLILALEDSDIIARAVEGRGGNIQILTRNLFRSPDSDIDASSQLGINGVVNINTPDVDPTSGLLTLPQEVVDVSGLIAQSCSTPTQEIAYSRFIVTGRSGLPTNPGSTISNEIIVADLGNAAIQVSKNNLGSEIIPPPTSSTPTQIVEASAWVLNRNGQVTLTANAPNDPPRDPWLLATACQQ